MYSQHLFWGMWDQACCSPGWPLRISQRIPWAGLDPLACASGTLALRGLDSEEWFLNHLYLLPFYIDLFREPVCLHESAKAPGQSAFPPPTLWVPRVRLAWWTAPYPLSCLSAPTLLFFWDVVFFVTQASSLERLDSITFAAGTLCRGHLTSLCVCVCSTTKEKKN